MSYRIFTIPPFDRQLKRLAKKYPSIKSDLKNLAEKLVNNPLYGKSLGNNCHKIRLAIKSKGKGKSGPTSRGEESQRKVFGRPGRYRKL